MPLCSPWINVDVLVRHSVHLLHVRFPVVVVRISSIDAFVIVREAAVCPIFPLVCPANSTNGTVSFTSI